MIKVTCAVFGLTRVRIPTSNHSYKRCSSNTHSKNPSVHAVLTIIRSENGNSIVENADLSEKSIAGGRKLTGWSQILSWLHDQALRSVEINLAFLLESMQMNLSNYWL